jgi:hypothetical protein
VVKTLVAIEVDLASSLAIRYACQLGNALPMELHPVYVKFPSPDIPITGVGWVMHTWEREVVEMGKAEIQEMLSGEMEACPVMREPLVIYGDREVELLNLVTRERFDLYIEGAPYPFTPATIYRRLHAKFYQRLACPLIWLRMLRKIEQALLLCQDPAATRALAGAFRRIWAGGAIPLHLALPKPADQVLRQEATKAREALEEAGCQAVLKDDLPFAAGWPADQAMKDYGLVAVALGRDLKKDSPKLTWLAQVKAPLLIIRD